MRYIFNPITEALEAPDNPSPMYDNLGKRFNLVEGGLARQPFAPKNVKRIADPPHSISDVELSKKLGFKKYNVWSTTRNKNYGTYLRTIEALGKPIEITGRQSGHPEIFWDKTNLTKDVIKKIRTHPSKWTPEYKELHKPGGLVLDNPQMKKAFIKAYNEGHGGRSIMKVIDPKNTFKVNQVAYGGATLTRLINSGEVNIREGSSLQQKEYFEKMRADVDADIKSLSKNKNPNITAEGAARILYPEFDKTPDGSPKKTRMIKDASYRLYDYYEWLNKRRPDSEILKGLKRPENANKIMKEIKKNRNRIWPNQIDNVLVRQYKFYELDKKFNKPFGHHGGLKDKLQNLLYTNKIPYVVEHGPSLSQSLTAKLPWYAKMVNLMRPDVNNQKIKLDVNILKAYEAATDSKTSVASKKKNKTILDYNKLADKFAKKWNVKVPKFVFGDPINSYPAIKNADAFDKQTSKGIYKTYNDFGWHLENAGTPQENLTKVVKDKISKGEPMGKRRQFIMAFTGIRNKLQDIVNKIPGPKVLKAGPGAAAAAIDYGLFHYILGVPVGPAGLGAASWMIKFPEGAGEKLAKINTALMAVGAGEKSPNDFLTENSDFLKEIVKEQFKFSEPYGEDDEVGTERLTEMKEVMKVPQRYAAGGPVVPRIGYKDGSNWLDKLSDDDVYNLSRGWRTDMKMDPEVMERIKLREIQKQSEAHEEGFLSPLDYEPGGKMAHKKDWGIIPAYQADVFKKSFGTKEGLQHTGTKLGQGVVEGTEWLIDIIPHVMKELDERGLSPGIPDSKAYSKMKKYLKENKGKFNWMELLMPENLTWHKTGWFGDMDERSKKYMEQLKDKTGDKVPVGVRSVGTAAWLGGMFADPFLIYSMLPKAMQTGAVLSKLKAFKEAKGAKQIDETRRDFNKLLGMGGVMAVVAKTFPFLLKGKKAKDVAKVAETVKQFGNVRGMPDWLPAFILRAKKRGKLVSLPDRQFVSGTVYEIMVPVKRKRSLSGKPGDYKTVTENIPVRVEHNTNTGEIMVEWTGTNNFGDDIERSMTYKPGETGSQNYAIDETGKGVSKERVVVNEPDFEYVEPDYSSMGFEDTSPDSAAYLDAYDDADEIMAAMEEMVKGVDDKFKKEAAGEIKLYNETDVHYGDAEGRQTADGDWIEGENNLPIKGSDDKGVTDVYHPKWDRKKKAMGGKADGPPPLSGPVPEGLRSLKPGVIYNEWIN